MVNGLDIYYSKNIGQGSKPVSTNKKVSGYGLKPVGNKQKANGLKPISKGKGCIKGEGLRILQ